MPAIDHTPMLLQASAGQVLTIDLQSMPGAGVVWQLPGAPAGCTVRAADSQASAGGSGGLGGAGGVGGPALQRFELVCASVGQHHLRFELNRPWESEVRAVQPVVVTVR